MERGDDISITYAKCSQEKWIKRAPCLILLHNPEYYVFKVMLLSPLKKLAIILFYVFQAGNLILLFYAFTHRQNSYPTPDTVVCYDFETVTGKRYHVKYSDWKNIRRHHWYNNTEVPDSIFDECLNLNKQQSTGVPTLYLPTCITSSIDVYQFWDGTMNPYCSAHVDCQSFKNTRSSGNSIIYMASDGIVGLLILMLLHG